MAIRRFNIDPLTKLLQQGYTLLTPNNRSVDGILREYANLLQSQPKAASAWPRPAVYAIDIYIQQIWQLAAAQGISPFNEVQLLNRFNEQEIWNQIVRESFDQYPLLDTEEAANSVARSYQFFKQWDVESAGNIGRFKNVTDFQAFLSWSMQFESRCKSKNLASLTNASKIIADNIAKLKPLLPTKIALINFNQAPPLYELLFEALSSVSEISWPKQDAKEQKLSELLLNTSSKHANYSNSTNEISACIDWCNKKVKNNPQAHIGIIIDPSRSLEPIIENALFKRSKVHNVESFQLSNYLNKYHSSEKLDAVPGLNAALNILALNKELVDSERFCKVLQSTMTIAASEEIQSRVALEVYLRRNFESEFRLSRLRTVMLHKERHHFCPLLAQALLDFSEQARREPARQSLRQWLQLFSRQLQILGWPGTDTSNSNSLLRQHWQQSIQRFAASSAVLGAIPLDLALNKLRRFFSQSNIDLRFDSRRQISLLDIEEAQDLVFDHVWLLAADDRNWPQAANPVAFLPYRVQQELGMPANSSQLQLQLALHQLKQLRNNTQDELVLSYHRLDEELSIRPSSLLKNIPLEALNAETAVADAPIACRLQNFTENLTIPLISSEEIRGGSSLLSNQADCPFKAFASDRLKAKKLEQFSFGLDPMARGNALHTALENLGKAVGSSTFFETSSQSELQNLIHSAALSAVEFLQRQHPETMTPAYSALEVERMSRLLNAFIELEKERGAFTVHATEQKIEWQHSRLALNFRIDRIDILADGSAALIDYKTGKKTNYKWFDDRPDDMQLPLYQLAIADKTEHTVSAVLIYKINIENILLFGATDSTEIHAKTKPLSQNRSFSGDWPQLQARWNGIIHGLVAEFESGLVAVAPNRGATTCQYCDFPALCRIAESDRDALTLSEDEL